MESEYRNDMEWVFQKKSHLEEFVKKNSDNIKMNLMVYKSLLEEFNRFFSPEISREDFLRNRVFQWAFAGFFGMRIDDITSADIFFGKMFDLKKKGPTEEVKPLDIVQELQSKGLKRAEFVFTTKMLQMIDGQNYPIYDDNVRAAFGLAFQHKENVLQYKDRVYGVMKIRYSTWATQYGEYLDDVARSMGCEGISHFKLIDSIIWLIGRYIKQIEKMRKKQNNE